MDLIAASGFTQVTTWVGNIIYVVLFLIALWGAFCVSLVWVRVKQKRFKSEEEQLEFLEAVDEPMERGDFDEIIAMCSRDQRAMCQLTYLACENRDLGFEKVQQLLVDRFQRDVLANLEHWLSWVNTVIKTAPMVGLFGTVIGMMGAFAQLGGAEQVDPAGLATNIYVALITTASGLAIAIPLVMAVTSVNLRIRKMEDLVGAGLTHFLQSFHHALQENPQRPRPRGVTRRGEPAATV